MLKYGITMRRDVPEIKEATASSEMMQVLFRHRPLAFTGKTYVDGSNVPIQCAPEQGRAGKGVASMGERSMT